MVRRRKIDAREGHKNIRSVGFSSATQRCFSAGQRILAVTASLLARVTDWEVRRIVGSLNLEPTRKARVKLRRHGDKIFWVRSVGSSFRCGSFSRFSRREGGNFLGELSCVTGDAVDRREPLRPSYSAHRS